MNRSLLNIDLNNCIFRYRKCGSKEFEALNGDRLYFSLPENFNDPYDALVYANPDIICNHIFNNIRKGMKSYIGSELRPKYPEIAGITEMMLEHKYDEVLKYHFDSVWTNCISLKKWIRSTAKMICFSRTYSSLLMWSHYADYHKGFIMVFNRDTIQYAEVYNNNDELSIKKTRLEDVEYTNRQIDMTEEVENYIRYNMMETPSFYHKPDYDIPRAKIRRALIQKAIEWAYEQEVRLIPRIIDSKCLEMNYIRCRPDAIIIGAKCGDQYSKELCEIAQLKSIAIYRMYLNAKNPEFELYLDEIHDVE